MPCHRTARSPPTCLGPPPREADREVLLPLVSPGGETEAHSWEEADLKAPKFLLLAADSLSESSKVTQSRHHRKTTRVF